MALRGIAGDMARSSAGIWKAVADVVDPKPPRRPPEPATEPTPAATDQATIDVEAGQMLVPIDAWTRILEQVGHVHEAGQQLADARERAAKAETENEFLKEQLRELKAQRRSPRRPAAPAATAEKPDATASQSSAPAESTPSARQERVRRARERASRWLSPS